MRECGFLPEFHFNQSIAPETLFQEKSALVWLERIVDVALDRATMSGPKVDLTRSLSIMRQGCNSIDI